MQTAAILLLLAALGGMTIAAMRLSGIPRPPTWLAIGHAGIAATGLGILIYTVATQTIPLLAQSRWEFSLWQHSVAPQCSCSSI